MFVIPTSFSPQTMSTQQTSTLFPYTTLFRSGFDIKGIARAILKNIQSGHLKEGASTISQQYARNLYLTHEKTWVRRSEEHTSELQSRGHLVCRLLLEIKNGMIEVMASCRLRV